MKLAAVGETLLERLLLSLRVIPTPLLDTHVAMLLSRTVAVATQVGVFDVLTGGPLSAQAVAERCNASHQATRKLLVTLEGAGYLRHRNAEYSLSPKASAWLTSESKASLRDQVLWGLVEWEWLTHLEEYIREGTPLRMHHSMSDAEWSAYVRAMRALANFLAPEIARHIPVQRNASKMLDIGGSHGHYSAVLCRRHPSLEAVILDLPEAARHAAPLLEEEGMGGRIRYWVADALDADLGTETWDLVLMAQLVHHFDEHANRDLTRRVARALRPGGVFVVVDVTRPSKPGGDQLASLYDLYFSFTSAAGTYTTDEIASWQRDARLVPKPALRLASAPGMAQQMAHRPQDSTSPKL